jgi:hypothetical protein
MQSSDCFQSKSTLPLRWYQPYFPNLPSEPALGTLIPQINPALKSWAIKAPAFSTSLELDPSFERIAVDFGLPTLNQISHPSPGWMPLHPTVN